MVKVHFNSRFYKIILLRVRVLVSNKFLLPTKGIVAYGSL